MAQAGLRPLLNSRANKFEELAYIHAQYADIEGTPAFKDFLYRLTQLREGMQSNLINGGGLDKWGNNHDDEIRAVLHALNTVLSYIPSIKQDFAKSETNLKRMKWGQNA